MFSKSISELRIKMKFFGGSKDKPVATGDDSTQEEQADQKLKFATASARFGPVGKRDKTWKTSGK
jgi:hypothetical protein